MAMAMQMQMQMPLKLQWQKKNNMRKSGGNNNYNYCYWRSNSSTTTTTTTTTSSSCCINALSRNANDASKKSGGGGSGGVSKSNVPQSNYVVPLDKTLANSSCITRPLAEILRDLNKRIPDNIIINKSTNFIPWYHANRMLSFYAPGWCGEIRDVIYSENQTVTVVYRLTIRGSDGEAYRESSGTISSSDGNIADPVAAAEEMAFCRACARFGLGLYLYHED